MKKALFGLGAVAVVTMPVVAVVSCTNDKTIREETSKSQKLNVENVEVAKFRNVMDSVKEYTEQNNVQPGFAIHFNINVLEQQSVDVYLVKNADDTWHMSMGGDTIKEAYGFFKVNMSTVSDSELRSLSKAEINNHREDTLANWIIKFDQLIANASEKFSSLFEDYDSIELQTTKFGNVEKEITIIQ